MRSIKDTELRYGYTLGDIEQLAFAAARSHTFHQSLPLSDGVETAWSAIAEHLRSSDEPPGKRTLIRAAWTALRRETEDEWHAQGVSRTAVFDGGWVQPRRPVHLLPSVQ